MYGELHLPSFFENPYEFGSIEANVHPGGGISGPYFCAHKNFILGSMYNEGSIIFSLVNFFHKLQILTRFNNLR